MKRYDLLLVSFVVCLFAGTLLSCTGKAKDESKTITVTIAPLAYLTEKIAGNNYRIETLVPNGSSPETYEPSPQQLVRLSNSKIYFYVGHLGFEQTWLQKMEQNAPNTTFSKTSEGIKNLTASHHHGDHVHEGIDPHVWTTPTNLKIMARNIAAGLSDTYPEDREVFTKNLKALEDSLDQTDHEIRHLLSGKEKRSFLIYHPTLSYFAHEYGLEQLVIEEDGKSPSPAHLQQLVRTSREKNVHTVFLQKEFDRRNAEVIARETQTQIVEINPLDYECTRELVQIANTLSHEAESNH